MTVPPTKLVHTVYIHMIMIELSSQQNFSILQGNPTRNCWGCGGSGIMIHHNLDGHFNLFIGDIDHWLVMVLTSPLWRSPWMKSIPPNILSLRPTITKFPVYHPSSSWHSVWHPCSCHSSVSREPHWKLTLPDPTCYCSLQGQENIAPLVWDRTVKSCSWSTEPRLLSGEYSLRSRSLISALGFMPPRSEGGFFNLIWYHPSEIKAKREKSWLSVPWAVNNCVLFFSSPYWHEQ